MRKRILTWAILRLIWESKGYSMKEMPHLLKAQFPGRPGFAFASIQRKAQEGKKAPRDVVRFVMDDTLLPIRDSQQEPAEVVRLGLAALRGKTIKRDPHELAVALLAHFPVDKLAHGLADALTKEASLWSGAGSLLDICARAIADRMPHMPKLRELKLARHIARHLDRLGVKRLALAGAAGGAVACVVGLVFLAVFHFHTSSTADASASPQAASVQTRSTQPVIIVANMAQGGAPIVFDLQALLGAIARGEMGKQAPMDQPLPDKPLPGQKLPPCSANFFEKEINGGCWAELGDKPPCRALFRQGDRCYRPIAADPQKPVGEPEVH